MSKRTDKIKQAEIARDERSFSEEIQHDNERLEVILGRPEQLLGGRDVSQLEGKEKKQYELELQTSNLLKRTLLAMETTGVTITDGNGKTVDGSQNGLPLSTNLMHGARIKFEIPAGSGHEFGNFIMNGTTDKDTHPKEGQNVAKTIDSEKAQKEGKVVFTRVVATHGSKVVDGKVVETKGPKEGLKNLGCHFGMNFGSGEYGEKDIHGRDKTLNGLSGHVYIYYKAPTKTEPGCMMVGMEGCVPPTIGQSLTGKSPEGQFDTHDLKGGADNFTTLGGRPAGAKKSKDGMVAGQLDGRLELEKQVYQDNNKEHPYKDTVIARRYDGMSAKVTPEVMQQLLKEKDNIPNDIGSCFPKPVGQVEEMRMGELDREETLDKQTLNSGCKAKQEQQEIAKEQAKQVNKKPGIGQMVKQFFSSLKPSKHKETEKQHEPVIGAPTDLRHVQGTGILRNDIKQAIEQANQLQAERPMEQERRLGNIPGQPQQLGHKMARNEAEEAKQRGEDPVKASKSAMERFQNLFDKLRGKTAQQDVGNEALPNQSKREGRGR